MTRQSYRVVEVSNGYLVYGYSDAFNHPGCMPEETWVAKDMHEVFAILLQLETEFRKKKPV